LQRGPDYTVAFLDRYQLIAFHAQKALDQAISPMDLKIGMFVLSESEMKPPIVHRIKARLPRYCLSL